MEFRLPSNLQQELLAYDPALKKLAAAKKQANPKAKAKYPLGNVNDLIPSHIVHPEELQQAVDYINSRPVNTRFYKFDKPKQVIEDGNIVVKLCTYAILFHFESLWVAAWLPGPNEDYLYGYAHAYRNTESGKKPISYHKMNITTNDNSTIGKYGRSEFIVMRQNFTVDHVASHNDAMEWRCAHGWGKGAHIHEACLKFENELTQTFPLWSDSYSMFERIKCKGIDEFFLNNLNIIKQLSPNRDWQPSFTTFKELILALQSVDFSITTAQQDRIKGFESILHIIDTPFMRRWIQQQMDQCIAAYNTTEMVASKKAITQPWGKTVRLLSHIKYIHDIWPDCPVDYYQNNIDYLIAIEQPYYTRDNAIAWLRQHMQPASYFQIIRKFYDSEVERLQKDGYRMERMIAEETGTHSLRFYELRDTFSMLENLLDAGKEVQPPKRWRITEFHDMLQAETWKIKHPNTSLPQDLFPEPVRVEVDDIRWSFFQPVDTHQLASWGQAVRNCVGSSKDYADGVRKHKHFIVLCMVDSRPQFTVQLDVNHGMMNVKQIAGISNARLTDEQREQYAEAFKQALQARNDALESA